MYYKQKLKPKPSQVEIDQLRYKLTYKVFDVEYINNTKYYIDKKWNCIWDTNSEIVGIIYNGEYKFISDIKQI